MSYNIDTARYLKGSLTITREAFVGLLDQIDDVNVYVPECSFVYEIEEKAQRGKGRRRQFDASLLPDVIEIEKPRWYGEASGTSFGFFKECLAATKGEADILLTWEGGDTHNGLRVKDGVVTEHEIVFALGEETE